MKTEHTFKVGDRVRVNHNTILGNCIGEITQIFETSNHAVAHIELDGGGVNQMYLSQLEKLHPRTDEVHAQTRDLPPLCQEYFSMLAHAEELEMELIEKSKLLLKAMDIVKVVAAMEENGYKIHEDNVLDAARLVNKMERDKL
jgi:hypothetical protein